MNGWMNVAATIRQDLCRIESVKSRGTSATCVTGSEATHAASPSCEIKVRLMESLTCDKMNLGWTAKVGSITAKMCIASQKSSAPSCDTIQYDIGFSLEN